MGLFDFFSKKKETIYWHLPGLCAYAMLNHVIFDLMEKYPNAFRENMKIGSVYGAFPSAIWNGGRNYLDGSIDITGVKQIIDSFNARNIPARFTWTNVLLNEEHIHDEFCNKIMEVGNNGFNQVLVNSPILEEYIRKTYPKYPIASSTTKRILDTDQLIEELKKDYFLVVLDYDFNHDEEVINKLLPYADRLEILVNENCQPHCPMRVDHYRAISKAQLEHDTEIAYPCSDPSPNKKNFKGCMERPSFMSIKDIEEYAEMGFKNFKIVGRGEGMRFYLDSLMYYLVKEDCIDFILVKIKERMNAYYGDQSQK